MDTILLIVPHPDDVAYGMGGTALLLKDRYHLHVLCATKGERGVPGQEMAVTGAIREKEEAAACAMIDAELSFLGLVDADVYAGREICMRVAEIIRQTNPVAVFTVWPVDSHPDHTAVSEIAKKACHLAGFTGEFYYVEEGLGSQTTSFRPDIYVDITPVFDERVRLIRCHACQNVNDGMVREVTQQSEFRGLESGCRYAEGFKMPLPPKRGTASVLLNC